MDARYSAKTAFFIPVCFATEVVPGKAGKEADACKRNRKNPRKFLRDEYPPPLNLPAFTRISFWILFFKYKKFSATAAAKIFPGLL